MLKGIAPCISPDLLKVLAEMGHGDEIALADANFPGHTMNQRVLRADGISMATLLAGILPLFELDSYASPFVMMAAVRSDKLDPKVETRYPETIRRFVSKAKSPLRLDRVTFDERVPKSFAVVLTGETAKYGDILPRRALRQLDSINGRLTQKPTNKQILS